MRERDLRLDAIKGIAILLVVIGHVIQEHIAPERFDTLFGIRIIYSFHMPLFMFVSGYVTYGSSINFLWLKKRFINLMFPFLSWIIVKYLIYNIGNFSISGLLGYIAFIVGRPASGGLWFLPALFWCCVILAVIHVLGKKLDIAILFVMIIMIIIKINADIRTTFLAINNTIYLIPFFLAGYLIAKNKNRINKIEKYAYVISSWLLFFPCAYIWNRNGDPFWPENILRFLQKNEIVLNICNNVYRYYVVASLGIIFVYSIIYVFPWNMLFKTLAEVFGKYTLEIYAAHWYGISLVYSENLYLSCMISLFLALCIPICLAIVVKRVKFMQLLLYGKVSVSIAKNKL